MEIFLTISIAINILLIYLLAVNSKKLEDLQEYSEIITDTLLEFKVYVDEGYESLSSEIDLMSFKDDDHIGQIIKTFSKIRTKIYSLLEEIKST